MKRKRLFIDMDGTVARFHDEERYLERMFEQGFFRNLAPFENLIRALKAFSEQNPEIEIFIISAYIDGEPPHCETEKHIWLDKYLHIINDNHRIFTPMGQRKSEFIPGGITEYDYLLDDYNKNLDEWQHDGGFAIKCKNPINHKGEKGPLWMGAIVDNCKRQAEILDMLSFYIGTLTRKKLANQVAQEEDNEEECER